MNLGEFQDSLDNSLYLGDGVYAGVDKMGRALLYTSNGVYPTNVIVLELDVLMSFLDWTKKLRIKLKE